MLPIVAGILRENDLSRGVYAEPFAGGFGLALGLLYEGHVAEVCLNDIDPAIWSFWHSVINATEDFISLMMSTDVTVEEWRNQRSIFLHGDATDPLRLGFSAFFLNRTNRSGIIKGAGVIGGLGQSGTYKIDCRFNKDDLAHRIRRVSKYKSRINVSRSDALEFIERMNVNLPDKSLICIDPPYYNKGSSLYTSFYVPEDHQMLARSILKLSKPWIVTYDNVAEINHLYDTQRRYGFDVSYSVQVKRLATELLVASDNIFLPTDLEERRFA